jgi:TatD DNase family protein
VIKDLFETSGIIHASRLYTISLLLYTVLMKYIDIHSHLGFEDYGSDQKEVMGRMASTGVATIAIGADLVTSQEAVKLAEEQEGIFACIGIHPDNIAEVSHGLLGFNENEFEELVKSPKVVAIGECGLDYFEPRGGDINVITKTEAVKENQKVGFRKQIEFAIKYNKPLMLHLRDGKIKRQAFADAYEILKEYEGKVRGNLHFFTANLEWAQKFIDLGFTISFIGLITYVQDFDKIIKNVPLTSLQAETDAPYVAPVPHRGERNEPSYVIEVYKKIAEIRGEDPEIVRIQLLENAKRVFGI